MVNYYKALMEQAQPVEVTPSETSYFSQPNANLDPRLFNKEHLIPSVRNSILSLVLNHFNAKYQGAEVWSHSWLAGSGVSHYWSAQRQPADLDCLIGVDFNLFRKENPQYMWSSNRDIADEINEDLRKDLYPQTTNFLGNFELTFYVNIKSNIVDIKPYAAYSLTNDSWTVSPQDFDVKESSSWTAVIDSDVFRATEVVNRYKQALRFLKAAPNDAARRNAEASLVNAIEQGAALFDEIHGGRGEAFSETGQGYADFANYRWQAGKQTGIIQALKKLKDVASNTNKIVSEEIYGMELPDAKILVRRAASQYKTR